jgi:uncharacterized protein (DUF983 family)
MYGQPLWEAMKAARIVRKRRVKIDRKKIFHAAFRFLRLLCPECGRASIFRKQFNVKHHCDSCSTLFQREDGFFMGSILVNVVVTEIMILVCYVALLIAGVDALLTVKLLLAVAAIFPFIAYHHCWSFWLGFNHLVNPLPKLIAEDFDVLDRKDS